MDTRTTVMSAAAYLECTTKLRKSAEKLIWQCSSHGPPYDPFQIAQHMGVHVDIEPIPGLDGYVEIVDGRYFAVISSLSNDKRRRFTLSHELGHVLFMREAERGSPVPLIRYRAAGCPPGLHQDPVEESLCNVFASELLLPTMEVKGEVLASGNPVACILKLSKTFDVSLQAAAKRVVGILGKKRIGCALWKNGEGKLWPMPLWSEGINTKFRAQLLEIESLISQSVRKRTETGCVFKKFGKGKVKAEIRVHPFGRSHSLVFTVASDIPKPDYHHADTWHRQWSEESNSQLELF
jgi:Zn-dependent peptidase ImmA (M78 family)